MRRPFIYIASLRRTGSTVLAEALTRWPHSFIFREPHLAQGGFVLAERDDILFRRNAIDLVAFKKRHVRESFFDPLRTWWSGRRPVRASIVDAFKRELIPVLSGSVTQIGVKEIFHQGWQSYLEHFPEARIILTGRDPRDVYISLYHRVTNGKGLWSGRFTPQAVAQDLLREFRHQLDMARVGECLRVRYEDLCSKPEVMDEIKAFTHSPILGVGDVGCFLATTPRRREEFELHGKHITNKRIRRWEVESDPNLLVGAQKTFELMTEYCEFWGYE